MAVISKILQLSDGIVKIVNLNTNTLKINSPTIDGYARFTGETSGYVDVKAPTTVDSVIGSTTTLVEQLDGTGYTTYLWWQSGPTYKPIGQTFSLASSATLSKATVYLSKQETITAGSIVVKLYNTTEGKPSGTALATSTSMSATSLTDSSEAYEFVFSSSPSLSASTTYAIVIEAADMDGSGGMSFPGVYVTQSSESVYADGTAVEYNGATWDLSTFDIKFVLAEVVPSSVSWTLTLPADNGSAGQFLQTDGEGNAAWVTVEQSLANLTDVNLTSPSSGDLISYDGSDWIDAPAVSRSSYRDYGSTTWNIYGGRSLGIVFQAQSGDIISKFALPLGKGGDSWTGADAFPAKIYEVTSTFFNGNGVSIVGQMTEIASSTNTYSYASLPNNSTDPRSVPDVEFVFDNVTLTAGTYYYIAAEVPTTDSGNFFSKGTTDSWTVGVNVSGKAINGTAVYGDGWAVDATIYGPQDAVIKTNGSGKLDQSFVQYNIDFNSNRLSGVAVPTLSSDVVNKNYVDNLDGGNTLQKAYEIGNTISTNSTDGDIAISGTQKLSITSSGDTFYAGSNSTNARTVMNSDGAVDTRINNASKPAAIFRNDNLTTGVMRLQSDTANHITVKVPTLSASYSLTLPANDGDASQFLQTNGSGVASWTTIQQTLAGMTDAQISSPASGDLIRYDGSKWVNEAAFSAGTPGAGATVSNLNQISPPSNPNRLNMNVLNDTQDPSALMNFAFKAPGSSLSSVLFNLQQRNGDVTPFGLYLFQATLSGGYYYATGSALAESNRTVLPTTAGSVTFTFSDRIAFMITKTGGTSTQMQFRSLSQTTTQNIGQTFSLSTDTPVTAIQVENIRKGNTIQGSITAYIYATTAGIPSGAALATSASIDLSTFSPYTATRLRFTFTTPVTLTANTTYACILAPTITNAGSDPLLILDGIPNTLYAGGSVYSDASLPPTTAQSNDIRGFRVYASGPVPTTADQWYVVAPVGPYTGGASMGLTGVDHPDFTTAAGSVGSTYGVDPYAIITAGGTSAANGIIKSNASSFVDETFLQYNINFGSNRLSGIATPTASTDVAIKNYVDASITSTSDAKADTNLANLTSTAINLSLIPGVSNTIDLGSDSLQWQNLYASAGLKAASTGGVENIAADSTLNIGSAGNTSTLNMGTGTGTNTINIGTGDGTTTINIGGAGDTVNIAGSLAYASASSLELSDKLVILNNNGGSASGNASGFAIEENGQLEGYIYVGNSRESWDLVAPASNGTFRLTPDAAYVAEIDTANLSANRTYTLPNVSGTLMIGTGGILSLANGGTNKALSASAGSIVYSDSDSMEMSNVGTAGQPLLSGGANAPTWFTSTGVVQASGGVLSTEAVDLTTEVSGVLPLANGGTSAALIANHGAIAYSDADSLELLAPGTAGKPLVSGGDGYAPAWFADSGVVKATSGVLSTSAVDLASAEVTGALPLANGGTNNNMTAVAGAVVYSDSNSLELTSAGTAGQVLKPVGSTPTFADLDKLYVTLTNNTGSAIAAGSVVCLSQSSSGDIVLADASALSTSEATVGIVESEIANGSSGRVQVAGRCSPVRVASYSPGSRVYLSETAGSSTQTPPSEESEGTVIFVLGTAVSTTEIILNMRLEAVN